MVKWIALVVVGLIGLVGSVALVGLFLPKGHRASRTVVYSAQPASVFAAITDFAKFPEWRTGITRVEMLADEAGKLRFREDGPHGAITYKVEERQADSRLVTRIDDPSLPFGGKWTLEVKPVPSGTELTITEDGEIYNPFFRVMSKLVFSPYDTIDTYQADLRKRLSRS
jgi:hypothetical protein